MFLDGIRYSVEMYGIAYSRLVEHLVDLSTSDHGPGNLPAVFLDAWSMVDSAHRLRRLAENMPHLQKSAPAHQVLVRTLKPATDLRHAIQHLDEKIHEVGKTDEVEPTWGSLSWEHLLSPTEGVACLVIAGSIRGYSQLPVAVAGRPFANPTDHIELTAFEHTVGLSAIWQTISKWVTALESAIPPLEDGQTTSGADLLLQVRFTFDGDRDSQDEPSE